MVTAVRSCTRRSHSTGRERLDVHRGDDDVRRGGVVEVVVGHDRHPTGDLDGLGGGGDGVEGEGSALVVADVHVLEHAPGAGEVDDLGIGGDQERDSDAAGFGFVQWCCQATSRQLGIGDYRPATWFTTFDNQEPRDSRRPFRW